MGLRALTLLVEIRSVVAMATGSDSTSRRPEARSGAPTTGSCGIGDLPCRWLQIRTYYYCIRGLYSLFGSYAHALKYAVNIFLNTR